MTTRKCVHLVAGSYFRSRNKDGGHAIRIGRKSSYAARIDAELLATEFSHCGDPDLCWHAGFRYENTEWLSTFFASVTLTLTR